jgi:hypothetical protein
MARIQSLQQRLAAAQAPIASPVSIPAPTKGWNTRDNFDDMDPLDAILLDNWFPDAGGVVVRNGFQPFATGMGATPVQTLAEYDAGGTRKLLAACGGSIFDISSGFFPGSSLAIGLGAIGFAAIGGEGVPTRLGSSFQSNQWQTCCFLNRLFFCNGADSVQSFDGTTLSPAAFTGVTTSTLAGVWQYQQRLFFWQNNSTGFWYALLNSINGPLAFYDLSAFCPRGGNLIAMTTSSYDGGNGVLDYAVFIMSSGDALLFEGNDPSLSSNWSLIGEYRISPPVSPRAVTDYGGDSFITTYDDHVTLQQMFTALRLGEMAPRSKVSKAVQLAVQANKNALGWQALYYPRGRSLIFNVPNPDGTFDQHVCNTGLPTQPWTRYVGMNANCWGLFNDLLYFGGANGSVYQADTGNLDNAGPIIANAQQSWNKLNSAQRKRITAVRPVIQSLGSISYSFDVGFDYAALNIPIPVVTPGIGSPWNSSPWNTSPWSSEVTVDTRWRVGGGSGTAVGLGLSVAATQPVSWLRADLRLEGGNAL